VKFPVGIWVLEDYEREVWSFKYHVKFPVGILPRHSDRQYFVLSHKGDVLVYSRGLRYMFHCDNTGKLIEEFELNSWSTSIIGPWFKESLVKPDFYLDSGNLGRYIHFSYLLQSIFIKYYLRTKISVADFSRFTCI
jgi:hypothetical protein